MRWRNAAGTKLFPSSSHVRLTWLDVLHWLSAYTPRRVSMILLTLSCLSGVHAQTEAPLVQMQELIDNGLFTTAAQEEGPRLLELLPEHPHAYYLYSYALYRTGSTQRAREVLEQAMVLQGTPASATHEWLLGLLLAAGGDLAGSEQLLARVYADSELYQVAMDWGRVAWQRGSYATAFEAFAAAGNTEEGKRELWPFLNQGRLLMQQERFEEAIEAFDRAITVYETTDTALEELPSPAYVEAYFRLGEVYERLGDIDNAVIFYEGARKADPLYMPATAALDRLRARALP